MRDAVGGAVPIESSRTAASLNLKSNFTKEQYLAAVARVIEYIRAGDIFQANLSQRFECKVNCSPTEVYGRLRRLNAAPFSAYLKLSDDQYVMSSSPERFLQVEGMRVWTRPIKGTRPRLDDPKADAEMRRALLTSEKDARGTRDDNRRGAERFGPRVRIRHCESR